MSPQGMELWRPDWSKIYEGDTRLPDVDGELLTVTRQTLRIALSAIQEQCRQDFYTTYGAAREELTHVLGESKPVKSTGA